VLTRLPNLSSSRFQSNHHREYFWPKTIMSSGARNNSPPAVAVVYVVLPDVDHCHSCPDTAPSTIAIGITVKMRKNVVSRLSGRSG
jgi:hypothetical protein